MKIGIDVDETVADLTKIFLKYAKKNKPDAKKEDITKYTLKGVGISSDEVEKLLINFKNTREYTTMEPIEGSVEGVNKLRELDNKIYFISARDQYPEVLDETLTWLIDNGYKFDGVECFQREKYIYCKRNNIDLMIEDRPETIIDLSNKGIDCIVFDQPWNRDIEESPKIKRCKSWNEIVEYISDRGIF